jgi:hypothetical protein
MSAVRSLSGARQTGVSRTQQRPLSPMGCHCNPSPARGIDGLPEPWRRSPRSGSTGVSRHERKPERGVGDDHARQSERLAPQYNHKTHQIFWRRQQEKIQPSRAPNRNSAQASGTVATVRTTSASVCDYMLASVWCHRVIFKYFIRAIEFLFGLGPDLRRATERREIRE